MGNLITLFHITEQALAADQAGLNVTANNVANQNTPGYARETVSFSARDLVTLSGTVSIDGGVDTSAPISQRDRVLEQHVEQQTQAQSQSATVQTALSQIENVFGLTASSTSSSITSLGTAVNNFFGSLTSLASDPSQSATRQQVLSTANSLVGVLNSSAGQLTQITSSLNSSAQSIVGNANALIKTIASLNNQIAIQSPNTDAGTLEDQRQQAIASLSQYVGLDQITTAQNGIELTTSNGGLLVAGANGYPLSTSNLTGGIQVYAGPNNANVTSGLTGGSLGGTLSVLTNSIPTIQSNLDQLAYSVATAVNTQNEAGVDANGNPGQALFTIGATAPGSAPSIAVATIDPNLIAAAAAGEGSSGNTNATALANLGIAAIVSGQTASEYLGSALAQVGSAASAANSDASVQQATLTQLTTQRNALSGVNLDEEAANLTQYQRSYQAASQVFAIINSLLASVINIGVETAVS